MATPDVNQQDIADRASNGDVEAVAALVLIHYRGYLDPAARTAAVQPPDTPPAKCL